MPHNFLGYIGSIFGVVNNGVVTMVQVVVNIITRLTTRFGRALNTFFVTLVLGAITSCGGNYETIVLLRYIRGSTHYNFVEPIVGQGHGRKLI